MRNKLLDEVTIQEMMNLREIEHLSNAEIAERLDVHYATVIKYIGKNPKGIRKPYTRKEPAAVAAPCSTEYHCAGLLPCGKDEFFIASNKKQFRLHNGKELDLVEMGVDEDSIIFKGLKKADVECLIGELQAAYRMMESA